MPPKIVSFDSGKRDILEILLPGSGKGIEVSSSLKKTYEMAKAMNRSVVMFDYPFYRAGLDWSLEKSRDEDVETLEEVLHMANAIEYKKIRLIGKSWGGVVATKYLSQLSEIEQKKYELSILGYVTSEIDIRNVFSEIVIFQGSDDIYGSMDEVREDVKKSRSIKIRLHEIGSSTHNFKNVYTGDSGPYDQVIEILFGKSDSSQNYSFTGREKPGIEPVTQKFDYDCGGAAVSDLLLMIGRKDLLSDDFYGRIKVSPTEGTKTQNIKKFLNEERVDYVETTGADLPYLEGRLVRGDVCLVCYQAWGAKEEEVLLESGHYSVVFKIDNDYVWVLDPTIETEDYPGLGVGVVRYLRGDFEQRWVDKGAEGEVYYHWVLAV